MVRRQDVDGAEGEHRGRMIERHAVGGARAPVVAGHHEPREAQRVHHVDLVLRHATERVVAVVGQAARLAAVAVAAQVGGDHGEVLGQPRRDEAPVDVRQGIAVEQEQGRSGASHHAVDRDMGIAGLEVEAAEAFVHHPATSVP